MLALLNVGIGPASAQDNPGYNWASNMSDYERARSFADIVNNSDWVKEDPSLHCPPSHTKFLGMKPDKRAGYVLYCQNGGEYLVIMQPNAAMTIEIDNCLVAFLAGDDCEGEWAVDWREK